ncbi:MAG: glutamate--tRNA ligase [Verrucomicrobiales bacterium]|nr:glutamate--tRNA ligase [Verrucomicrobiales bacterium]
MSTTVRTRFAPSPTGHLHIGSARTALFNWLLARHTGGTFVLRVEDTDAARNTEASRDAIFSGLKWLGMDWDEGPQVGGDYGPYFQSERNEIYDRYLAQLEASDRAYKDESGATRFRMPDQPITIDDLICGSQTINLKEQGATRWDAKLKKDVAANPDLVIRRADGSYIFHFVNVVDDIDMKITHVIRGEDHLSNTPKHAALFEALGAPLPIFVHIPLNLNADGSKMSKRDQGASITDYIEQGFLPSAVCNYIALLGWSPKDDEEIFSLEKLIKRFELSGINRSNSRFDFKKCLWLNGEHLRRLDADELLQKSTPFLTEKNIPLDDPRLPAALQLIRERAETLDQIPAGIAPIFSADIEIEEKALAKISGRKNITDVLQGLHHSFADQSDWSEENIKASIVATAEKLELKMGALMLPCRIAATGKAGGPDLLPLLVLIGKNIVLDRITQLIAKL